MYLQYLNFSIMPAKKAASKKRPTSLLSKLSEQVGHVKDKLIEEKNHLMHIAGETVDAIKEKVHDLRAAKPVAKKKAAKKKAAKKAPVKKKRNSTSPTSKAPAKPKSRPA